MFMKIILSFHNIDIILNFSMDFSFIFSEFHFLILFLSISKIKIRCNIDPKITLYYFYIKSLFSFSPKSILF